MQCTSTQSSFARRAGFEPGYLQEFEAKALIEGAQTSRRLYKATAVVQSWLEGASDQLVAVNVNGELVDVSVEGVGELKPLKLLRDELESAIKHPVIVRLRAIPAELEVAQGASSL